MKPREIDSLELVELVMVIEEVFGKEIPSGDAQDFGGPREIVDWLERNMSNSRPSPEAKALLKKLAKDRGRPELAEGLDRPLRREQIAAIVREFFRDVD